MSITETRWWLYRLPLRSDFTTAHNAMAKREGAIVEITTSDGLHGYGEIAPLPEFSGGDLQDAITALASLARSLKGESPLAALRRLYATLDARTIPPATCCGLEIALLDILGKSERKSIARWLLDQREYTGQVRVSVPVNAVIGDQKLEATVEKARSAIEQGFACIKLKVGRNVRADLERVAAVRAAIGPAVHLRLDANEGWNFEQARQFLDSCAPYQIQYIEQPLPANDVDGMQRLRRYSGVPLASDEALHDLESAYVIVVAQAADVLVIKPQLAGGLHAGQQIMSLAAQQDVQCVVTSTIEAGIGLVGALHLAVASPEITLECGLATLGMLVDDLICEELVPVNGRLVLPDGPGLGVHLDHSALEKYIYATGGV